MLYKHEPTVTGTPHTASALAGAVYVWSHPHLHDTPADTGPYN